MIENFIIGHENIIKSFDSIINKDRFSHAHIFLGESGIGKSLVAKALAIKLIGKTQFKDYVDIVEFKINEKKLSIGVNDIRLIIEEINKKPYETDKKVVIIHDAHKMTTQAQNAFLKTIEEPAKNVSIFLLCENIENILDTIQSRCQIHKLKPLNREEMKRYLKYKYNDLQDEELELLLSFSRGIPKNADKLKNDQIFNSKRDKFINMLLSIKDMNSEEIFNDDNVINTPVDWEDFFDISISFIRDTIIYKEIGNNDLIINKDKLEKVKQCANIFSFHKLNDIITIINETRENIDRNVNNALVFNVMLLKIQEV